MIVSTLLILIGAAFAVDSILGGLSIAGEIVTRGWRHGSWPLGFVACLAFVVIGTSLIQLGLKLLRRRTAS